METKNTHPTNPFRKLPWSTPQVQNLSHEQSIEGKAYSKTEITSTSKGVPTSSVGPS